MEERIGSVRETKAFEQLGVLVLDGSGSMGSAGVTGQTRADEVNHAVRGLISRMKVSRMCANFQLAVLTYDEQVKTRWKPTPVADIDDTADYNPLTEHGGQTAMGDALEAAAAVADSFLAAQTQFPRSAVLVVLTDGQNNRGKEPVGVADAIKAAGRRVTICAAGYGKDDDVDSLTLQKMASEPAGFVRAYDGEALRKFFEASISKARG